MTDDSARAALARARARLDHLALYPERVRTDRVRLVALPLFFRIPGFRRYDGYALWRTILLRRPVAETSDDLITHELCHIWQMQHRPWRVMGAWLTTSYRRNPYELEAREAAATTRRPLSRRTNT